MSSADREIELKFTCGPADLAAVLAAAPAGDDETRELISVYFDTPDLACRRPAPRCGCASTRDGAPRR